MMKSDAYTYSNNRLWVKKEYVKECIWSEENNTIQCQNSPILDQRNGHWECRDDQRFELVQSFGVERIATAKNIQNNTIN